VTTGAIINKFADDACLRITLIFVGSESQDNENKKESKGDPGFPNLYILII